MFTAALFTEVERWKQPKRPSADDKQEWSLRKMEHRSAMKRNDTLTHAAARMDPGNIMSRRSQSQRATCVRCHLYEMSRIEKSMGTESRSVVARGQGRGMGGDSQWDRVSLWGEGGVLELDHGGGCTAWRLHLMPADGLLTVVKHSGLSYARFTNHHNGE